MNSTDQFASFSRTSRPPTESTRRRRSHFKRNYKWSQAQRDGLWVAFAAGIGIVIVIAIVSFASSSAKPRISHDSIGGFNLPGLRVP